MGLRKTNSHDALREVVEREHPRDLPDHPDIIDHRLPRHHAVLAAAVEHDLAGEGVARVVQDFAHYRLDRQAVGGIQQPAQLRVFRFQLLQYALCFVRHDHHQSGLHPRCFWRMVHVCAPQGAQVRY